MKTRLSHFVMVGALAVLLSSCSEDSGPRNTGVYLLLDTSGTYAEELDKARQVINVLLSRLEPADSLAVARIDTGSFSEKDIVARVTFDDRPSVANQQKRRFREHMDDFADTVQPSRYTDITGGLLQAIEYLNEKSPGRKTILIFSDLKEDLKAGYVRDLPLDLEGFQVIALNVTKLGSDNIDPREYMQRLSDWQARVQTGGGEWRVINDLEQLEKNILG